MSPGAPAHGKKPKLSRDKVWREARELIWAHRRTVAIGLALMMVSRLTGLVLPASSKFLIDNVLGEGRAELLIPLAVVAGVATLVQAATNFALSQVVSVAAQRAIADMRRAVQAHVLRLPVAYFDATKSGILISRIMNDAEGVRNLVGTGLIQLTGGYVTAALALVVLLYVNWQLTLAVLVLLGIFGGGMIFAFRRLRPIFRQRGELTAQVTGRLAEALGGVRVVKIYTTERREQRVFTQGVHRLFRNIATSITGTSSVTAFATVIVGVVGVLIMIVGGNAIMAGTMTVGDLVLYILFVGMMAAPLIQIASIGTQITEAFAGLDRIREVRETLTEDAGDAERLPVVDLEGEITFDDVSFEYDEGVPVLRDVSFRAAPGSTTALVGPSGAGKTTIINLVMAFARPTRGRVMVDGADLAELRLREYRGQIGVVLQDNFLFDGTIRENIAMGNPRATVAEIEAAGRIAHCDEFVDRFEKRYDTIIGERGVKLSGGQRQRVAIARAIVADPRILILDEATSSLDSESEAMIRDGLRNLRQGRTTFVIAHRLSTIQSADQILVLDDGRIVERGTHHELLAEGGLYRRLYERQHGVEQDTFINPGEDLHAVQPEEISTEEIGRLAARIGRSL